MRISPQRLAWITMIAGLVVFCLACVGTAAFGRWLILESPTDLTVTLRVGLGTIGLAEPDRDERVVRTDENVPENATMTTDPLSQGYMEFTDPYTGDVLATVTLRHSSIATLERASRPRFNVSDDPYVIRLRHITGRLDIWVSSALDREIRVVISTGQGTVRIGEGGNFLITTSTDPGSMDVMVRQGSATLERATYPPQHLRAPSQGTIRADNPAILVSEDSADLLPNWDFSQSRDWPVEWACAEQPSDQFPDAPSATLNFTQEEGRAVAQIQRYLEEPSPFTYGCIRYLAGAETGLDVSEFDDLRLRVSMQIHHQSLSACGIAGTECPVMLEVTFRPVDITEDQERIRLIHGFYVRYDPNEGGQRTCAECRELHEQINKDTWYTYESGNLLTDYFPAEPANLNPAAIISVRFYSAGHEYDISLDEVALIASRSAPSTAAASP